MLEGEVNVLLKGVKGSGREEGMWIYKGLLVGEGECVKDCDTWEQFIAVEDIVSAGGSVYIVRCS